MSRENIVRRILDTHAPSSELSDGIIEDLEPEAQTQKQGGPYSVSMSGSVRRKNLQHNRDEGRRVSMDSVISSIIEPSHEACGPGRR